MAQHIHHKVTWRNWTAHRVQNPEVPSSSLAVTANERLPMLSAAERVVLRMAINAGGFVSERDLNDTQTKVAKNLVARGLLKAAGQETDRTAVYQITPEGRSSYRSGL